jgi:hypothetical protein
MTAYDLAGSASDRLSANKLRPQTILGMRIIAWHAAFAVNPARLKARPCGLQGGLTAQRAAKHGGLSRQE